MSSVPRRISYGQNNEDVRAWRALQDVDEVFYVEVGASDPVVDSLTAALSASGARGLLIEADPEAAALLRRARPRDVVVAAAATARPGVLVFHQMDRRGWGSVDAGRVDDAGEHVVGTVAVPAVRLADVLDELAPAEIHFMSVDVEGHEVEVLAGAGLDRHRPWVLCVESTRPNSREQSWEEWEPSVLAAGYSYVAFDGLNRWYVSEQHPELRDRVAEPFGVLDRLLDGWVPAELDQLERRIADRDDDVSRVEAALGAERRERAAAQTERAATEAALQAALAAEGRASQQARETGDRLAEARRETEATAARLRSTSAALDEATARAARVQGELERLRASLSWRLTGPAREVLHALSSGSAKTAPHRSAVHAVFLADRALQRRPEWREAVLTGLGGLPLVERRLRALAAVPDLPPPGSRGDLHATANMRVRAGAAATWRRAGGSR